MRFWLVIAGLGALVALAAVVLVRQWVLGLGVTGLSRPVYWGIYITNFVFFIGISHAGTLISAILRVTNAEWRRPITRIAEAITFFALILGAMQILIDLGRLDRVLNVVIFGRFQSPLLWDVTCITLYLLSSTLYLYLPMIPDLARLREQWATDANSPQSWQLSAAGATTSTASWRWAGTAARSRSAGWNGPSASWRS